jgi:hypothetical protein
MERVECRTVALRPKRLTKVTALHLIDELISSAPSVATSADDYADNIEAWKRDAIAVLSYIFPNDISRIDEFKRIQTRPSLVGDVTEQSARDDSIRGLNQCLLALRGSKREIAMLYVGRDDWLTEITSIWYLTKRVYAIFRWVWETISIDIWSWPRSILILFRSNIILLIIVILTSGGLFWLLVIHVYPKATNLSRLQNVFQDTS